MTHRLITKILRHTKRYIFCQPDKINRYDFDSLTLMTIVVLAVVIFWFDNLREKRSGPLTKLPGTACFKNSWGTPAENCSFIIQFPLFYHPQELTDMPMWSRVCPVGSPSFLFAKVLLHASPQNALTPGPGGLPYFHTPSPSLPGEEHFSGSLLLFLYFMEVHSPPLFAHQGVLKVKAKPCPWLCAGCPAKALCEAGSPRMSLKPSGCSWLETRTFPDVGLLFKKQVHCFVLYF